MWEEIQKRPFSRPLFLWITGILIQTCWPGYTLGILFAFSVLGLLFLSLGEWGKEKRTLSFAHRWVWGLVFSVLFVSLAIGKTGSAERRAGQPTMPQVDRSSEPPSMRQSECPLIRRSEQSSRQSSRQPSERPSEQHLKLQSSHQSIRRSGHSTKRPAGNLPRKSPRGIENSRQTQQTLLADFDKLRLTDEEKSILATLTLGYRKAMNRDIRRRFSSTGVSHLLAVSGLHVGIVCGFLTFLFAPLARRPAGRQLRYILSLLCLWGYVWITGLAASAVRAGIMLSIYLVGRILKRSSDRYNTWCAAAFCMLAYDPLYLFDIGFQLSYLAVFSILFFQPRLERLIPVRNPLIALPWQWLTVTLAAQVGTTFLCLYYFRQFSWVFLFTNLPLTGLATLLIPAGLLWILLPPWLPGYGSLQMIVEMLTRSLLMIVDTFARLPGASYSGTWSMWSLWMAYTVGVLGMLYVLERRPLQLLAALSGVLIILIGRLIGRFMLWDI